MSYYAFWRSIFDLTRAYSLDSIKKFSTFCRHSISTVIFDSHSRLHTKILDFFATHSRLIPWWIGPDLMFKIQHSLVRLMLLHSLMKCKTTTANQTITFNCLIVLYGKCMQAKRSLISADINEIQLLKTTTGFKEKKRSINWKAMGSKTQTQTTPIDQCSLSHRSFFERLFMIIMTTIDRASMDSRECVGVWLSTCGLHKAIRNQKERNTTERRGMNEVKTRVKQKRNCELSLLLMIFASVSGVFQARLVSLLSDRFFKRNKF